LVLFGNSVVALMASLECAGGEIVRSPRVGTPRAIFQAEGFCGFAVRGAGGRELSLLGSAAGAVLCGSGWSIRVA